MGKRKHKKSKLIYRVDSVEDLRGVANAPADFRLTFWLSNSESYRLLFDFEENELELILKECEKDGYNPVATQVEIPAEVAGYPVTKIKNFAFKGALKQDSLSIPNTIKSIGANAFCGCGIHDLFIPASVSEIGVPAFQNSEVFNIRIDKDNKHFDSRNDCNAIIDTAKNELIAGGANAFIPDSVTNIGNDAFSMLLGVKEIIIPQAIQSIGELAFGMCLYLEKVSIASSIIGENTFSQCENLKEVLFSDSVTKIRKGAFRNCRSLKEVIIPSSVTMIESEAFQGCSSLERIVIPDSVEEIEENTFYACKNLKEVQIPNSIKKIDAFAFSHCENLEKVTISNSVERIGAFAFFDCNSLERFVIPDSVGEIEENTFYGCGNLKEVQIPNSVKRIGAKAFRGCKSLGVVHIPDSVTFIGLSAFFDCNKAEIHIKNTSLLKAAFELSSIEIFESEFEDIQERLKDTDFFQFYLHRGFQDVYWEFFNNAFGFKQYETINNILLESMRQGTRLLNGRNLFDSITFIKNIHLFSQHVDNQIGDIDLYIDKSVEERRTNGGRPIADGKNFDFAITDSEDAHRLSCRQDPIFDSTTFDFTYWNSYIDGKYDDPSLYSIIEFSMSPHETILNGKYRAVVVANRDDKGNLYYELSPYLQSACDISGFLDGRNHILHKMDLYSDVISNFFFVFSFFYDPQEKADFVLMAEIDIDKNVKTNVDKARVFLKEFKSFMDSITQLISFLIQTQEHRKQALEGAIAKVMARNMSHNIGSHVFSHLLGNSAYERLSDKSVSELHSYISCYDEPQKKEQTENPDNCQLTFFNKYLKNRMDYLSEVTFGVPNVVVAKNIYGEVFKELDNVRILLNHISGIADFKFGFSLMHNGVSLSKEDIMVAFPGDVLGCQAFYNIIENIIRNTAKHANKKDHAPVMFNIDFIDKKEFPNYYCVEVDNGIKEPSINSLVQKQNGMIDSDILDQNFNLRTYGLGIVEMKASCAFLRQLNMSAVDSSKYSTDWRYNRNDNPDDLLNHFGNLILLKAINKNGALGYRFFVQKPKELLFVGNWNVEENKQKKWSNVGVSFVREDVFVNTLEKGEPFSHSFLIYHDNLADKSLALLSSENDSKTLLPQRKLRLTQQESDEVRSIINATDGNLQILKDRVWKLYMGKTGVENDGIYIGEVVSRRPDNRQRRQVVFENHSSIEQHNSNWAKKTNFPELWVDNLSSQTQSKLPLFSHFSQADNPDDQMSESLLTRYIRRINHQTLLELFDAYHNKIVAMDERIQRFANENYEGSSKEGGKIPVSALFESTNVLVPAIKLDPEWFDERTILNLENFLDAEIGGAFLLVHYGILERMYKTESLITQHLEAWARKAQRVVVTSGRGSHSLNLPKSVCFANLSSMLNAFVECRSKYLINCLINQSRRKNE